MVIINSYNVKMRYCTGVRTNRNIEMLVFHLYSNSATTSKVMGESHHVIW